MGNYHTRTVNFLQSPFDFPCPVALGKQTPFFGLHRYKEGLRFVPPDNEGFTLRGDKQRLTYKGQRRSHRITILGDTAFEYDCILLKEPESNIVSLMMEGAEHYDFFRQPEFLDNPLLAGSYAVYKKETLLGEGTGKLCHINRPEIIDNRGRRCWGDLSVTGNILRITIPEKWLSEAKYPVIVDPVVGTSTIGSQNTWVQTGTTRPVPLMFENAIAVNRFTVPDTFNGECAAYAYVNEDDPEAGGRPVFYSDNGNVPQTRKSAQEGFIDLRVTGGKPVGWRSATFRSNGSIAGGSYIWFGVYCEYYWFPRFDWGAKCYADWLGWDDTIPNTYPISNYTPIHDFKLSMYFTYVSPQNYVRRITQGVELTDSRKLKADYKRNATQTASVNSSLSRFETFYRKCVMAVNSSMNIGGFPLLLRTIAEHIGVTMGVSENRGLIRKVTDAVKANSETKRIHNAIRKAHDILGEIDTPSVSMLFVRSIHDTSIATHKISHWTAFIRGLRVNAGSVAETSRMAGYCRFQADTVEAAGSVFRGLLLLVRIVTQVFFRDYIIGRFLKAKQEWILKSPVCREIILDSKIE